MQNITNSLNEEHTDVSSYKCSLMMNLDKLETIKYFIGQNLANVWYICDFLSI